MSGKGVAQQVYSEIMLSDAARNEGRNLLANIGNGGTMFGDGLVDVLGPPMRYGETPYFAREHVQMYTTGDAYLNTNLTFFVSTIEGMYHMLPSFPSEILPPVRTNELHIKGYSYGASRSIAEITPEYAPATYLEQERTDVAATLERRAKALRMNTGFWKTPDGKASFAIQQVMLRNVMLLTMDSERFHCLYNAPIHPEYRDAIIKDGKLPHNSLSDMFQQAKNLFAVLHTSRGLPYLHKTMSKIFENNIKADTYLFPPDAAGLNCIDPAQIEYYRKGGNNERAANDEGEYLQSYLGTTIYEVPYYYIDDRDLVTNFSTRRVKIGDATAVMDFYPGSRHYTTGRTRTAILNMDAQGGRFEEFDIDTVTKFSGIFTKTGAYSPALQDFVTKLNAGEYAGKIEVQPYQLPPLRRNKATGHFDLIDVIGEMHLAFLSPDHHREIINGFIDKFQDLSDPSNRKDIVDGLALMERLSKPDLTSADVRAYFAAVKTAIGNVTTGIAPANAYGTLDIKSITANTQGNLDPAVEARVEPYGYGTWSGIRTLAAESAIFNGGAARKATAERFVEAIQKMEKPLSGVFRRNVTFDPRFCPFFLRTTSNVQDEALCTFVHSLLAPDVKPVFVEGGTGGVFADIGQLFNAPGATVNVYAPLARQLAFLLGESPSWQTATTGSTADAKRATFNGLFLRHENEYRALLNPIIAPGANDGVRAAAVAQAVADKWLAEDRGSGRVLRTDENGSVEPFVQLAYNLIRYNLNDIGLPTGKSQLDAEVIDTWAKSNLGEYRVMGATNVSVAGLASTDLNRTLANLGATPTSWVNTRLFIDGSAFSRWATNVNRLSAAAQATAVAALNIRPANPVFPGVPVIGNTANVPQFIEEMSKSQSEYADVGDPMRNLISHNDTKMTLLTEMQKATDDTFRSQMQSLMTQLGAPRFAEGNELITRWNHVRASETDPIRRAVAIMYLLQQFDGLTMSAFKENDVPLPYEGLLLRVSRRYTAGSVILLKKGSELGNLFYGHDAAEAGETVGQNVWKFVYSIWFGAMIKRPDHMLLAPDVTVHKYHGGEGVKIYEPGKTKGDINVLMVPYGSASGKRAAVDLLNVQYPVDVTGFYNPSLYSGKVVEANVDYTRPTYPGYLFYREYYGFDKLRQNDPWAMPSMSAARRNERDNTICYEAGQWVPNGPEPDAQLLSWKRSQGPFGEYQPDNSKDIRRLPSRLMLQDIPEGLTIYRK